MCLSEAVMVHQVKRIPNITKGIYLVIFHELLPLSKHLLTELVLYVITSNKERAKSMTLDFSSMSSTRFMANVN